MAAAGFVASGRTFHKGIPPKQSRSLKAGRDIPPPLVGQSPRQEVTKILKPFHIRKKIAYFAEELQLINNKYNESTFRPS